MTHDWVKPGAKVIVGRGGSISGYVRYDKIDKVYKTGNFTLEGGRKQQFRPYGDGTALATGDSYGGRTMVTLVTEHNAEQFEGYFKSQEDLKLVRQEASRLLGLTAKNDAEELRRLADEIRKRTK